VRARLAWWALFVLAGCGRLDDKPTMAEAERRLQEILVETVPCGPEATTVDYVSSAESSCESGICEYNMCVPLARLDAPWQVPVVIARLKALAAKSPDAAALEARAVAILADLVDTGAALAFRARALHGLEELGARDEIIKRFSALPLALQGQAAISLARLGDATGIELCIALTEDEDMPVVLEAIRALGTYALKHQGAGPDVLPTLLAFLSPDIDLQLQRATLAALREAKDARAMGPLVAYLEQGPDALADQTGFALDAISGTRQAADVAVWQRWLAAHPAPAAPAYEPKRGRASSDDIELPEP